MEIARKGYKIQLENVSKAVEKYQHDAASLQKDNVEVELYVQRELVTRIEERFKSVQMNIIENSPADKTQQEEEDLLDFINQCFYVKSNIEKLFREIHQHKNIGIPPKVPNTDEKFNQQVYQVISLMNEQLKMQQNEKVSREIAVKEILDQERENLSSFLKTKKPRTSSVASTDSEMFFETTEGSSTFVLEPIKLPIFSGDYCEWISFKNLFLVSVDRNGKLSKSHKMQYLRTSTTGEAHALFSNLPISDHNYKLAWNRLEKRYDNPLFIVASQMEKFLNQPTIATPDVASLRKLQSSTSQSLEAIDALGAFSRDPWLIHLTLKHLDFETQMMWSEKAPDTIPTWTEFEEFLDKRCRSLESCPSS